MNSEHKLPKLKLCKAFNEMFCCFGFTIKVLLTLVVILSNSGTRPLNFMEKIDYIDLNIQLILALSLMKAGKDKLAFS